MGAPEIDPRKVTHPTTNSGLRRLNLRIRHRIRVKALGLSHLTIGTNLKLTLMKKRHQFGVCTNWRLKNFSYLKMLNLIRVIL